MTDLNNAISSNVSKLLQKGDIHLYRIFLDEVEKTLFKRVMEHCRGNKSKAARILGINRITFMNKYSRHFSNR